MPAVSPYPYTPAFAGRVGGDASVAGGVGSVSDVVGGIGLTECQGIAGPGEPHGRHAGHPGRCRLQQCRARYAVLLLASRRRAVRARSLVKLSLQSSDPLLLL